jgi:uncharacterized Zn-finger protein
MSTSRSGRNSKGTMKNYKTTTVVGPSNKKRKAEAVESRQTCNICQKTFSTRGNLKRHQNTHTGLRKHVCAICKKDFFRSDDLSSHLKTHNNKRPYTCSCDPNVCNAKFKRLSDCRKHERRRHDFQLKKKQKRVLKKRKLQTNL